MSIEIGKNVKKFRELRNFTQEYMAEQLAISQQGYSKIERGEGEVAFSKIEQIAKILNIRIKELIEFDEKYIFNNTFQQTQNGFILGEKTDANFYERLLLEKDQIIADKNAEILYLRELVAKKS
jgi:transcriptional regulator with XRE-family HTH domain